MTVLSSLPERPLTEAEVSILNRSEPVTLAVAVETEPDGADTGGEEPDDTDGDTRGILLATDEWVRGIAFTDGTWEAVVTDSYDDSDARYDALRQCESAVRSALDA